MKYFGIYSEIIDGEEEVKSKTIDVINCKDCKYWCPNQKFQNDSVYYCSKLGVDMKALDFCSRGEQKDE